MFGWLGAGLGDILEDVWGGLEDMFDRFLEVLCQALRVLVGCKRSGRVVGKACLNIV